MKIIPKHVRGLGNLLSHIPVENFKNYGCTLEESSMEIDHATRNIFSIDVDENFIVLMKVLQKVTEVYTDISDVNGTLVATSKSVSEINSINDLNGVIINMVASETNWSYDTFVSSGNSVTDFNNLQTMLVDFEDIDGVLRITTLEDL